MAQNLAIVVGVNHYEDKSFENLRYAKRDAELMKDFLDKEAGFEVCLFFNDSPNSNSQICYSSPFQGFATQPRRSALRKFLREKRPVMRAEDSLWFFFSGHGLRDKNEDYLMLEDSDPSDPEDSAIALSWVANILLSCGAGHIVLIVDACRNGRAQSKGEAFGSKVYKGVTTIFSCEPDEISVEIDSPVGQGSFTYILLENFRKQTSSNCLTIAEVGEYLREHVPALNRTHKKRPQCPRVRVDPIELGQRILLPQYADQATKRLQKAAVKAEQKNDLVLALEVLTQALKQSTLSDSESREVLKEIQRITLRQIQHLSFVEKKAEEAEREDHLEIASQIWLELSGLAKRYKQQNYDDKACEALQRIASKKAERIARSPNVDQALDEELSNSSGNPPQSVSFQIPPPALVEFTATVSAVNSPLDAEIASTKPPKPTIPNSGIWGLSGAYLSYTIMSYAAFSSSKPVLAFAILIISASTGLLSSNGGGILVFTKDTTVAGGQLSFAVAYFALIGGILWLIGWLIAGFLKVAAFASGILAEAAKLLGDPVWIKSFTDSISYYDNLSIRLANFLLNSGAWAWSSLQSIFGAWIWGICAIVAIAAASILAFTGKSLRDRYFRTQHVILTLLATVAIAFLSGWGLYSLKKMG